MSQKLLETLHEALQGIRGLPPDEAIAPLQANCERWYHWLKTPHTVIAIVATDTVKTTPSFHEAARVLAEPSLGWQVTEVCERDYVADITVYMTMASSPWREDELNWLSATAENAPSVLLLLLDTEALDQEETQDATEFAEHVLRSRIADPSRFIGVAPTANDALQMLRSHNASTDSRARHVWQLLCERISQSLADLHRKRQGLPKEIAEAQHEYAQLRQRADAVLRELLVRQNTLEPRIARIVRQTQVEFSEKITGLQRKYHRLCESEAILQISTDIENSFKSDIRHIVEHQMRELDDKLTVFFREQVEAINASRQSCGSSPMEIDPQRWVIIPFEVLPEPSLAAPRHSLEISSYVRDALVSMAVGTVMASIGTTLFLPAGIVTWLGLNWEQRRRKAEAFRNQFVSWIDKGIAETERQFVIYLNQIQDKVVKAAVEMYTFMHEETSQHIARLLQQHPSLPTIKNKQAQLSQLQSVAGALEEYRRRVLACNGTDEWTGGKVP